MIDIYLRADTAEALRAACPWLWDEANATWIGDTPAFSLSIVGPIPPTYAIDETGEPGDLLKPGDPSFHVNLLVVDPAIIDLIPADILIDPEPDTPMMVWA